ELLRDHAANLVVRQQLRRRVCPGLVIEQLTLRPDRERRNQKQDRRQREQDPDKHAALLAHPRLALLTSACLGGGTSGASRSSAFAADLSAVARSANSLLPDRSSSACLIRCAHGPPRLWTRRLALLSAARIILSGRCLGHFPWLVLTRSSVLSGRPRR